MRPKMGVDCGIVRAGGHDTVPNVQPDKNNVSATSAIQE